jgi:hypothetical protein
MKRSLYFVLLLFVGCKTSSSSNNLKELTPGPQIIKELTISGPGTEALYALVTNYSSSTPSVLIFPDFETTTAGRRDASHAISCESDSKCRLLYHTKSTLVSKSEVSTGVNYSYHAMAVLRKNRILGHDSFLEINDEVAFNLLVSLHNEFNILVSDPNKDESLDQFTRQSRFFINISKKIQISYKGGDRSPIMKLDWIE